MTLPDIIEAGLVSAAQRARAQLAARKFNAALETLHGAVEQVITDPSLVSEIYGSPVLDVICAEIGDRVFAQFPPTEKPSPDNQPTYVYLATKLQRAGGHTRVLCDFIAARPEARHVILLTGGEGRSDTDWLAGKLGGIAGYRLEQAPRGNQFAVLRWLQSRLVSLAPTHTYVFNHHGDSAIIAAVAPSLKLHASFCHHGDHQLCLGVHSAHLTHLDFHPMGYACCRDTLGIDNRYIPLVAPDHGVRDAAQDFMTAGLLTATAAGANKIERPYPVSYFEVIPDLLAATGGRHLHIGPLSARGLARLRRNLAARGVAQERFTYLPWTSSVWETLLAERVDFYVGSFPYGGGRTMIEAMGAGIPTTAHRHWWHRALGGFDQIYANAFCWREPEALIRYCKELTPAMLAVQSREARAFYQQYHRPEILRGALDGGILTPPPMIEPFTPVSEPRPVTRRDQLWMFAYRLFRRMRRRIGSSIR